MRDLYLVEVERQQGRPWHHTAPGKSWEHTSLGREEDPIDAAIVAAKEDGAGPRAYGFGDKVVAADEALIVYVKGLLSAVGVDVSREGGQESSPLTDAWQGPPSVTVTPSWVSRCGAVR